MIPPQVIAAGGQVVGGILGGNKRRGEARVARRAVDAKMEEAIRYVRRQNKKSGQTGAYDFQRLRDDAIKAGFNPLTVLQATGGAGYDVGTLSSPFGNVGDMMVRRAELVGQMSGAVIDNAGYFGDAIASGTKAYVDQLNVNKANQLDADRTAAISAIKGGSSGAYVTAGPFAPSAQVTDERTDYRGGNPFSLKGVWERFFGQDVEYASPKVTPGYEVVTFPGDFQYVVPSSSVFDEGAPSAVRNMAFWKYQWDSLWYGNAAEKRAAEAAADAAWAKPIINAFEKGSTVDNSVPRW